MGKLTVRQLEALDEDDIGRKLFDGDGLYGRVRKQKSGKVVTFEFRYTLQGRTRTIPCGKWPKNSLKNVRKARDAKQALLDEGIDPVDQARVERLRIQVDTAKKTEQHHAELAKMAADAAALRTFREAIEQWQRLELSRRKDGGKEAIRALNKDILPIFGALALVDVKRPMLLKILDGIVERGARVMANHLFGDLRQFYNYAVAREWVEAHPLAGLNKDKIGGRQKERDRHLSEEEIVELNEKLKQANLLMTTEVAIWLMISTCCRVGELSQARWEHVNMERGEWLIPADHSKNAKSHTIYLSDFSLELFQQLQIITGDSEWCYPSRNDTDHICQKSISKQIKDRVRSEPLRNRCKASGVLLLSGGPWTPHDLRRTGATLMGELGVLGDVIERCLNHKEQNKLKRIYQRHELKEEQKHAWRLLGERLTLLLSEHQSQNVIVGNFSSK